jgi:hypothetical protein
MYTQRRAERANRFPSPGGMLGFSYISIMTGVFELFFFGFGTGGPAFIWTWPAVFVGQFPNWSG